MNKSLYKTIDGKRLASDSIFELTLWIYERQRRRHKDDYQPFSLSIGQTAFFETVEDAEETIPTWIEEEAVSLWPRNIYCFRITEYPIGQKLMNTRDNLSERIYDQNGRKLDERLYPSVELAPNGESEYYGRPDNKIRYKSGDLVEFAGDLFVIECFMTPLSEKRWTSVDETDDGYVALRVDEYADEIRYDKDGYVILDDQNPQCTEIFPPRFAFSPKVKRRIANIRKFIAEASKRDSHQQRYL